MTKPRTASGRFAPSRVEEPKRSASERHAEAKAELKRLELERDSMMARRKGFLLSDDRRAARRCGHQLRELELALQEARDLDDLLLPEIRRERQQQTQKEMPTSRAEAWAKLLNLEQYQLRLESIKPVDRSAHCDAELDAVKQQIYYLTGLVSRLPDEEKIA